MERGEIWAYKETPKKAPVAVRIMGLGTSATTPKAKVEFVDDRFEGLQRWVTMRKLPVLWDDLDAWIERERAIASVTSCRRPSPVEELTLIVAMSDMPEHVAEYDYKLGYIRDEEEFERIAGVSADEISAGLPCFYDEDGLNVPIEGAIRMAKAVAAARPTKVLKWVNERELEEGEWCRYGQDFDDVIDPSIKRHRSAEQCRERYRDETEPMLAQLRDWCGYEPDGSKRETPEDVLQRHLDDSVALAERAIAILRHYGHKHDADELSKRLRDALGLKRISSRGGRGKGWFERD
ncbi:MULTISPECIES: hypothetical protein [unclassified Rathayibacter]|uniref:hypothetical protein n=1 Tax=unclassified Rathayibacter TaxID=2609250 RepID=UPI0010502383|nr:MULTISPECIES: hypothetical protein [unclassified Rathayibacter]TCL80168.1 hypothetical protein EDF49_110114 [Rathayibacter sp. PhB192]TCM25609.1 hypothetical protein EDF43_110114 [Rathayibacter sp. PhB179]